MSDRNSSESPIGSLAADKAEIRRLRAQITILRHEMAASAHDLETGHDPRRAAAQLRYTLKLAPSIAESSRKEAS